MVCLQGVFTGKELVKGGRKEGRKARKILEQ
jgi:hypothetical protein